MDEREYKLIKEIENLENQKYSLDVRIKEKKKQLTNLKLLIQGEMIKW